MGELIVKALLLTITLLVPPPSSDIRWGLENIPNQLQVKHKDGLEVSYPYKVNDCRTVTPMDYEFVFEFRGENVCYLIDTRSPNFIRYSTRKWIPTSGKTYIPRGD